MTGLSQKLQVLILMASVGLHRPELHGFMMCGFKNSSRTSEVVHWVIAQAAKPEDLNFIPGTHTVQGGNQLTQAVFCFYVYAATSHQPK